MRIRSAAAPMLWGRRADIASGARKSAPASIRSSRGVILHRRGFLGGLLAAIAGPALVKVDMLIPVTRELIASPGLVIPDFMWVAQFDIYKHMFEVAAQARAEIDLATGL